MKELLYQIGEAVFMEIDAIQDITYSSYNDSFIVIINECEYQISIAKYS